MDRYYPASAAKFVSGAVGAAGLVLASQAIYVARTTPRLPPPEGGHNSGHDFPPDGLVIPYIHHDDNDDSTAQPQKEFRLVLLGDSPVEGVGNESHGAALGGRTAQALSERTKRPVRYWSYGKSGLTARGIRDEMVPHLQRLLQHGGIDAVVICCGVNNVTSGHSADNFRTEAGELLNSVMGCCRSKSNTGTTKIIVMELVDFAVMPFLPWPLSKVLSWRSQTLQRELEAVVLNNSKSNGRKRVHYDDDANNGDDDDVLVGMAYTSSLSYPQVILNDHPLLDHMSQEEKSSLKLTDFFADDGFHPANHGTTIIGKCIANTYTQLCS